MADNVLITPASRKIQFYESTANGTNYVALVGPTSIAADVSWVLPSAAGANGQLLSTDGSNNLSWTTKGTGTVDGSGTANYIPKWTDGDTIGNSIIYDSGSKIGIGTSTPGYKLDIWDAASAIQRFVRNDASISSNNSLGQVIFGGTEDGGTTVNLGAAIVGLSAGNWSATASGGKLVFKTTDSGTTTLDDRMIIDHDGKVGIGIAAPVAKLHVYEETANTTTASNIVRIQSHSSGTTGVGFGGAVYFLGERNGGDIQGMAKISAIAEVNSVTDLSSALTFQTATSGTNTEKVRITYDGKVGIGTNAPTTKLHVGILGTAADPAIGWGTDGRNQGLFASVGENAIGFSVNQSKKMELTTTGLKVGVGNSKEPFIQATNSGRVASNPGYSFNGDVDTGMYNPNVNNTICFATAGSEVVRILSDGNVGIGITNPGYLLDVNGTANIVGALTGAAATFTGSARFDGNVIVDTATGSNPLWVTRLGSTGEAMSIKVEDRMVEFELNQDETTGDHLFKFNINSSTSGNKYYQFHNGRVGINRIPSTNYDLDVVGAVNFDGALTIGAYTLPNTDGNTGYHLQTNGSGTVTWAAGGAGTVTGTGTANYISKWTGASSQGNSIIQDNGTSVGVGVNPNSANKLQVNGQARATTAMFGNSAVSNVANAPVHIKYGGTAILRLEDSASSNYVYDLTADFTNGFIIKDVTSSKDAFTIQKTTGYVGIGTTDPGYLLDVNGTANIGGALTVGGNAAFGAGQQIQLTKVLANADFDAIRIAYTGSWSNYQGKLAGIHVVNGNNDSSTMGRFGVTYGSGGSIFTVTDLYDGGFGLSGDVFTVRGDGKVQVVNGPLQMGTTTVIDASRNITGTSATFSGNTSTGGIPTVLGGILLRRYVSGWSYPTHDVLYNSWYSTLGDYVYLKAQGNSSGGHGMVVVSDLGFFVGATDIETGTITNSATTPITTTWAKFAATSYINGSVGIGITNPGYKLDVNGTARLGALTGTSATFSGHVTLAGDGGSRLYFGSKIGVEGQITSNNLDLAESFANTRVRCSTAMYPTSSITLGTSANRWTTVYGVAGSFSGQITAATLKSTGNTEVIGKLGVGMTPAEVLDLKAASGDTRIRLDAASGSDTEIKFYNAGAAQYTIGHDDATDNFVIGGTNVDTPLVSISKTGTVSCGAITATADTDALFVKSVTNANAAEIAFSSHVSSYAQVGRISYQHGDGSSYGGSDVFTIGSTESAPRVLADGLLMFKSGLALKPATGTGAGTTLITSGRALQNITTISSGAITTTGALTGTSATFVEAGTGNGMGGVIAATASSGGNAGYRFQTGGSGRWQITTIGSSGSESLRFYDINNSVERMRIDAAGNVAINNTGASARLDIRQDTGTAFRLEDGAGQYFTVAAGGDITMRGDLGVGASPSAWTSTYAAADFNTGGAIYGTTTGVSLASNLYFDGTDWTQKVSGSACNLYAAYGGQFFWYTAANSPTPGLTTRMKLDTTGLKVFGNLGVGAAPHATHGLYVQGSSQFVGALTGTSATFSGLLTVTTQNIQLNNGYSLKWESSGATKITGGAASAYLAFDVNSGERMRILSDGNVGIGITNPSSEFYVNGRTQLDGDLDFVTMGDYITFYGDSSQKHSISSRNSAGAAADDLRINTYGALFINLDSNSNNTSGADFSIGRHGSTGSLSDWLLDLSGETGKLTLNKYGSGTHTGTATYKLSVDSSGNIIETAIGAGAVDGSGTANYVTKWTDGDTIGNSVIRDDGTNVGIGTTGNGYKLRVQGNVYISGTLTEASSIAIKENIETYSPSLEKINKIRPVRYNKKESNKKEVGLVAEELAEMFPELVETDEKGNAVGVNYSRAVAVLLHGFKELYKEVKELKEKI